jgi:4,5-dihydroxyphthalate decarboxylase
MAYSLAVSATDRTYPILANLVSRPGLDLQPQRIGLEEIFKRQANEAAFDIAELTLGSYLVALGRGEKRLTAIPVPLMRRFRRDQIYVSSLSTLRRLADLRGKRFGLPEYQATPGIWLRAMLRETGLENQEIEWFTYREERVPIDTPAKRGKERGIPEALLAGEIDAGFFPRRLAVEHFPLNGKGGALRRLLHDPWKEDRTYYARKKFFPIGSVVTLRAESAEADPALAGEVYRLFADAKIRAVEGIMDIGQPAAMDPFLAESLEYSFDAMGADLWPYGFKANWPEVEAFIGYLRTDGLLDRSLSPEEVFHPSTLDT